jgi:hypothetical protein
MNSKKPSTASVVAVLAAMVAVYGICFLLGRRSAGYQDNVSHLRDLPADQQITLIEKLPMTDAERRTEMAKFTPPKP